MKKAIVLLLTAALVLSACSGNAPTSPASASPPAAQSAISQPEPPPQPEPEPEPPVDNSWKFDTPENHQMDSQTFLALNDALAESQVYAMLTAKDGVIIHEFYNDGYDENSMLHMHSCSKSFTSALVGIAIQQGYIGGVDDHLYDYLPQVLELADTHKQKITLRHLLTHTSGLEWYEWGSGESTWGSFRSSENWVDFILNRRLTTQPGSYFAYSTGGTHLLTAALEQATGMNAFEYGKKNIFQPLGMEQIEWGSDPQGVTDGGNGVVITARDAARFGQLYLNGGVWNDRQIIPPEWLEESTSVQNAGPGGSTGQYGYQWWIRPFGSGNYDTYYAFGAHGQFIFLVPELNLVTVISSNYPQNSYAPRPFFTDYVLEAYTGES